MSEINLKAENTLQLVLVRPGSTDLDEQGRIKGALSLPLSANGEEDARRVSVELSELKVTAIFSSPCLAAQQTAQHLSNDGRIKTKVDEALVNLDHGLWHGKLKEELKETQPKLFKQWQDHPETICPPNGETVDQVRARVTKMLKRVRKKYKKGIVVFVVPEPVLSIIRSEIEGTEIDDFWQASGKCGDWFVVDFPVDALA